MSSLVIETEEEKETLLKFVQDIDVEYREAAYGFTKKVFLGAAGNAVGALVESASKLVPGGD